MLFKTSIKKCFILTALLMLLTGCTINYNLTIDNNSVSESISGSVDKNEYELEDGDTGLNLFYTLIKKDVPALVSGDSLYNKDITETDNGINYNYTYTYRNNIDKARVINECFENHYIDETDEYYNIKLSGGFYCLYSNKIDINVISNYEVLNNNAKKVNGNKYTWTIDNSNNVDIMLTVSKTVKYEEPSCRKRRRNPTLIKANELEKHFFHNRSLILYLYRLQNSRFFRKGQVACRQLLKGSLHGPRPCHHHDVPAGLELFLVQAVDLPDAAAGAVAHVGFAQLFADGDAHPVSVRAVLSGVKHQKAVGNAGGVIQAPENMVELQAG